MTLIFVIKQLLLKLTKSISNIFFLLSPETVILDLNNSSLQNLIVSSRWISLKSDSTSNDAIKHFEF